MSYVVMAALVLGLFLVLKLLGGIFKLVLILIVVGLLIATFASKDQIDGSSVAAIANS